MNRLLVAVSIAVVVAAVAPAGVASAAGATGQWGPSVSVGGALGTINSTRGEAVYWTPLWQSPSSLGFLDFRGKVFDGSYLEGNVALGARAMLPGGYNFGFLAGYDARRSGTSGNVFQQVSGGLELLGDRYAFRANGYVPLSGAMSGNGSATVFLSGNDILMRGAMEVPLYGVDGEFGARLFASDELGAPKQELWAYGGGYWFGNAAVSDVVAGPKARLEWQINDVLSTLPGSRLTFGAAASHDAIRDTRFEVQASLRIPIGGTESAPTNAQHRRMADPLVRDTDIVVEGTTEHVEDVITGVDFDRAVTVAAGDTTNGMQNAISVAGSNGLIIVNGNRAGQWLLYDSQTLLGGGGTIAVRGLKTGTVADFTAAGVRPVLTDVADTSQITQNVIIANSNTHVAGLEINSIGKEYPSYYPVGAYPADIHGDGLHNVAVTDNVLRTSVDFHFVSGDPDHPAYGAYFSNSSDVVVEDNEVYAAGLGSFGITLHNASGTTRADSNTIRVSGDAGGGLVLDGDGVGARGNRVTLAGEQTRGIAYSGGTGAVIDYNTVNIESGDNDWAFVFNGATGSTLDHNTATTANAATKSLGIFVQTGSNSTISNNSLSVSSTGINILTGSTNLAITGNTFTTGGDAIRLKDGSYLIADNVFTGNVTGDVVNFALGGSGPTMLPDSSGNSIAAGTTGIVNICGGGNFHDTWSIMDNRTPAALHTYTDSCGP